MMRAVKRSAAVVSSVLRSLAVVIAAFSASTAIGQDWEVNWSSIDGGGELLSESANNEWQLSGTLGQSDATPKAALSGNGWSLTAGFWAVSLSAEVEDGLFSDNFEDSGRGLSTQQRFNQ